MKHNIVGASLLVAGTTIGASMIALPMTSATLGFSNSLILLGIMWVVMLNAAFVMIEISQGKAQSIALLAGVHIGRFAKVLAGAMLLILFWALLSAYIAGASSLLHLNFSIDQRWLSVCYGVICTSVIVWKTKAVDYSNRFLMAVKIVVFLLLLVWLLPYVRIEALLQKPVTLVSFQSQGMAWYQSIPIFFAAFGFHGSIPSLMIMLKGQKKPIYLSLIIGSLVPFIVYVLWQIMTLGVLDCSTQNCTPILSDVGAFVGGVAQSTKTPHILLWIHLFTFIAITTSFLGVGLGLLDFAKEWFPAIQQSGDARKRAFMTLPVNIRLGLFLLVLPLSFAIFYPTGFVYALGFAAMALSVFAVILPCWVAFHMRSIHGVDINRIKLGLLMLVGFAILILESFKN